MDVRTIIACLVVLNFTLAAFMFVFVKVHKTYPGFVFWTLSNLSVVVAYILFSLRGLVTDFISVVIANSFAALAAIFKLMGVRQFFGKKTPFSLFGVVALVFLLMGFFTYVINSADARVVVFSICVIGTALYAAYIVLKNFPSDGRLTYIIITATLFCYSTLITMRAIEWLFITEEGYLLKTSIFNTAYFMYLFIFDVSWTTLFLIINHQRLSHELTLKNNDLEETNKIKDKFFAILAHDLKNPFNGIIALSDLLLMHIERKETNKIQESLKVIRNTAEQTYSLLSNLLNWAKTQIGAVIFNPDLYNLHELLEDNIAVIKTNADLKNIKINNNIRDDIKVYVDEDMINVVLRNLLMNTIKFSHQNSEVIIDARENDDSVVLAIKDQGVGIPREDIKKLFKPGEIIATKGTDSEQGSGIGLLLCKEYITINSGEIWAESEPGRGSCFYVSLKKQPLGN
jgi:two-component system sensor histidine kinase/response regulator